MRVVAKKWIRNAQDEAAIRDGCYFDTREASRVIRFFSEELRHTKGEWAGQPFVLKPWQKDILCRIFGWKRPDGTRRYRRVYIEVPRKNGKSTLCAGIGLYLTVADREMGAEVYSAASDTRQARIVFEEARSMVAGSLNIREFCKCFSRRIVCYETNSWYEVLSADAPGKHGLNAHGIIFDELHTQPSRDLWDVLLTSTGARRQPLVIAITTAGFDKHSLCWYQHQYAKSILDCTIIDTQFFSYIAAAEDGDDWTSPAVWKKANPCLGDTIKLKYIESECAAAKSMPSYENTFKRLHLNIWTEQATRWLSLEAWDACSDYVDLEALEGASCHGGLDLSSTTDITALVFAFKYEDKYVIVPRFYVPAENMRKREETDHVPYNTWAKQGYIIATPGNVVDQDFIREDIKRLCEKYHIKRLAIDRWNAAQITTQLGADGLDVMPFGQGYGSMNEPTKRLERLVLSKQIMHGGNPVLRWMAGNVSVEQDAAGNLKPSKAKSTERIDGIVACIMALGSAGMEPEDTESVYETMGAIVI